tara:strand:- start:83 stop:310 length:228 start_codon:yes stop_codon:yes gene_type:complete
MKTVTEEYKVFNIADLKKDDELCNTIYQKFWLESEDNINPWADENLDNKDYFSKETFLESVELNDYEFTADGRLA